MSVRSQKTAKHLECSTGQVIAAFGRHYAVEAGAGAIISCVMRGKKGGIACGDWVEYQHTAATSGVIESIKPRSSKLYRSDAFKEKIIAANITQLIVVVAAVPSFSEELINRCLVAAESERIDVFIVLNKADLVEQARTAMDRLTLYRDLGYRVISLSALYDASILVPYLAGHASVFAGQSGMGKSTLLNALIPQANRAVGEISLALDSGCHTTTHSRMYRLDQDSAIIDSPGFQEFGLNHVAKEDLAWGFVEFRPYIGRCRFSNCRHINEPGCAIAHAVEVGGIQSRRWDFYQKFCTQI